MTPPTCLTDRPTHRHAPASHRTFSFQHEKFSTGCGVVVGIGTIYLLKAVAEFLGMGDTNFARNPRKKAVHICFQLASTIKSSLQGFHHTMENACIEGIFQDDTIPLPGTAAAAIMISNAPCADNRAGEFLANMSEHLRTEKCSFSSSCRKGTSAFPRSSGIVADAS